LTPVGTASAGARPPPRRVQRACALRDWARALAARLARKLAVLLHHLWSHQEEFRWAAA